MHHPTLRWVCWPPSCARGKASSGRCCGRPVVPGQEGGLAGGRGEAPAGEGSGCGAVRVVGYPLPLDPCNNDAIVSSTIEMSDLRPSPSLQSTQKVPTTKTDPPALAINWCVATIRAGGGTSIASPKQPTAPNRAATACRAPARDAAAGCADMARSRIRHRTMHHHHIAPDTTRQRAARWSQGWVFGASWWGRRRR